MYNTVALLILLYDSDFWTVRKKDLKVKKSIKSFRAVGYTLLDLKRN